MNLILLEVLLIFLLLLINGIFSMSELAVVSARRIRLQQQAEKGNRGARVALELAENPNNFLSTVQIGITLVGILAGAFGGATIAGILSEYIKSVPFIGPYAAGISFALVVAVITYFSIIIGELIPKSLALNSPEKIASIVSRPMKFVSSVSAPVVWLLSVPTAFVLKLFRVQASVEPPVTDEEIKGLIDVGTEAGVFEETEQDLMKSIIHLSDQRITSLMTPRTEIVWLDLSDPVEKIKEQLIECNFSRLPVADQQLDRIRGYVTAKTLLAYLIEHHELNLTAGLRQPLYVPETLTILELLEQFQEFQSHFALIVDEFGGIEGLVTMNDVMEAIVGELPSNPFNVPEQSIIRQDDGSLIIDGRLPILEFKEELDLELPSNEQNTYQTLAGFVLTRLGKVPRKGDRFNWNKFEFEVLSMEGNRVEKVKISEPPNRVASSIEEI
jgi:putative hemolysin